MTVEGERSTKFVPAFFLDVVNIDQEFQSGELPLHITTFPPVEVPYNRSFTDGMRDFLNGCRPFTVTVEGNDKFGPEEDVLVKKIKNSLELFGLHTIQAYALGELLHDDTYIRPYDPHITVKDYNQLEDGTELEIGGFSVIEKTQSGLYKVIDKIGFWG